MCLPAMHHTLRPPPYAHGRHAGAPEFNSDNALEVVAKLPFAELVEVIASV